MAKVRILFITVVCVGEGLGQEVYALNVRKIFVFVSMVSLKLALRVEMLNFVYFHQFKRF